MFVALPIFAPQQGLCPSPILLQVLQADRPKQPADMKLVYVDKDRARQREEKALQVGGS
jgi:hypothetical protein